LVTHIFRIHEYKIRLAAPNNSKRSLVQKHANVQIDAVALVISGHELLQLLVQKCLARNIKLHLFREFESTDITTKDFDLLDYQKWTFGSISSV